MNKLFLILFCSFYAYANTQAQVLYIALQNSQYNEPEHKVFFSRDMKDWKIIEPESECMNKYALVGVIALGVAGLVGGFLWARWYSRDFPKV